MKATGLKEKISTLERFQLKDQVAVITGGAGLLGRQHAEAVAEAGGIPVIVDINQEAALNVSKELNAEFNIDSFAINTDITQKADVVLLCNKILEKYGRVDILINNAANDPKVKANVDMSAQRFENLSIETWMNDLSVGLTGAFLCSQVLGAAMAKKGRGVILNISSDLGIIAPDQRLYKKEGVADHQQDVKPVTYSVIKHGLIGLTKYLATYWADQGVRANAICPAGVYNGQPDEFVQRLSNLIPMGRMANLDEYKAAVVFLVSDASSYMNGTSLIIDGGRSIW